MSSSLVRKIIAHCGYELDELIEINKGYRNRSHICQLADGRKVNLVLYKNEPGVSRTIVRSNLASSVAHQYGLPARRTLSPVIRIATPSGVRYACLYSYLQGRTIPWEAYTKKHIKLLGKNLALWHGAARSFDNSQQYSGVSDICARQLQVMEDYFGNYGVANALQRKLELLPPNGSILNRHRHLLEAAGKVEDQQLLHMDFVRGNVLFDSNPELRVSGILDFEKSAWGHPNFDLARSLSFLLVDCKYKAADKVRKYFLDSGYRKRGGRPVNHIPVRLSNHQSSLLDELVGYFLLYDFYKFLRHNPYQFLLRNEHFIRTRDRLLAIDIIKPAKPMENRVNCRPLKRSVKMS